jgi:Tfp pilus assembly protein PilP
MKKSFDILRIVCCLTAAMFLWGGCDDPPQKAAESKTVRKKVTAKAETGQKPTTPPAPADASATPPKTAPAPASEPARPVPATPAAQLAAVPPAGTAASSPVPSAPAAAVAGQEPAQTDSQVAILLNIKVPPPYDPKGKVDPFLPLVKDEPASATVAKIRAKADPNRAKTPLEKLDLGQLKLVAVIAAPTGNRALVEESSGKGYIIRTGTLIGLNSGKVVGIQDGKVLIEEEFEDVYGKTIIQKKEITLPKPPGEL